MDNLNFIETLTVEQFKAKERINKFTAAKNQYTSKLFMIYGTKTGAISNKGVPEQPMVSLVNAQLDREPNAEEAQYIGTTVKDLNGNTISNPKANGYFYMLHEEGHGGAETLATF